MLASLIIDQRQGMFLCMKRTVIVIAALIAMVTQADADFAAGFAAYSRGDYQVAVDEWRTLADQGDIKAQVGLGFMHEKGLGVPQDYTKAVRWYRLAAEQGDAIAQYNLGVMYGNGTGVLQDYVEAHRLFTFSATRGNEDAKNSLSYIEKLMTPTQLVQARRNSVEVAVKPAAQDQPIEDKTVAAQPVTAEATPPATETAATAALVDLDKTPPAVAPTEPKTATAAATPAVSATPVATTPTPVAAARSAPTQPPVQQIARSPAGDAPSTGDDGTVEVAAKPQPLAAVNTGSASANGPWSLHLVSIRDGSLVEDEWQRLQKRHPSALGALSLAVEEIDIPEKGHFFRVLAGSLDSEASAKSVCGALAAADQYCRPIRR